MNKTNYLEEIIDSLEEILTGTITSLCDVQLVEDSSNMINITFDNKESEDNIENHLETICQILLDRFFIEVDYHEINEGNVVEVCLCIED